MKAQ
jgi:hypothetical protein